MSFVPGDETVADGTMARAIYDAMIAMFGANAQIDEARKEAAAAMAIGICEHANPRLLSGDVTGPETSTDNAIPRWDGTAGGAIQDSAVTIDDSGNIALASGKTVDGRDVSADGAALDEHETRLDDAESDIASLDSSLGAHLIDTGNPHAVTAAQVGAVPTSRAIGTTAPLTGGGALSGDLSLGITDATTSFRGTMSSEDKAKLDGVNGGTWSPTVTLVSGLTGTPTVAYAGYSSVPIDGGPLRHVECTVRGTATLSGSGPGREATVTLPFDRGGNFSSGAAEGGGVVGGFNVTNGRCAPSASAQTFRLLFDASGSSGGVTYYAHFAYDTVA